MLKKIKIKDDDLLIILVVFAIALLLGKEIYNYIMYQQTETVIGKIEYVLSYPEPSGINEYPLEELEYNIYVLPYGREIEMWDVYTLVYESETESEFIDDLDKMPELAVGNTVEIEYRVVKSKKPGLVGKEIISIKSVEPPENPEKNEMKLVMADDYSLGSLTRGSIGIGDVVNVVRHDGFGGYFIYIDEYFYNPGRLSAFWIEDAVIETFDDDIRGAFERGSFDGRVRISIYSTKIPFEEPNIKAVNQMKYYIE